MGVASDGGCEETAVPGGVRFPQGQTRNRIERSLGMIFAPGGRPACDRLLPSLETEAQAGHPRMARVGRRPGTGILEYALSQKTHSTIAGSD